jgi:hypothetical protein
MRMAERAIGVWAARSTPPGTAEPQDLNQQRTEEARLARTSAKRTLAAKGSLYRLLRMITALMTLDVWIFGRVRTGPFFVLLERETERR